jgi:hypothetical protein
MSKPTDLELEWLDNAEEGQRQAWVDEHIKVCPCNKHKCSKLDDYVEQEFHCEDCFRDCVEIENENEKEITNE